MQLSPEVPDVAIKEVLGYKFVIKCCYFDGTKVETQIWQLPVRALWSNRPRGSHSLTATDATMWWIVAVKQVDVNSASLLGRIHGLNPVN